jgi:hypothetical protein
MIEKLVRIDRRAKKSGSGQNRKKARPARRPQYWLG